MRRPSFHHLRPRKSSSAPIGRCSFRTNPFRFRRRPASTPTGRNCLGRSLRISATFTFALKRPNRGKQTPNLIGILPRRHRCWRAPDLHNIRARFCHQQPLLSTSDLRFRNSRAGLDFLLKFRRASLFSILGKHHANLLLSRF